MENVEILGVEVSFYCEVNRSNYDFGSLNLECEGREFVLDVVQTYYEDDSEGGSTIECEVEVDFDTFPKTEVKGEEYNSSNLYNLEAEDFFNKNLKATLFIGDEYEEEPESITLFVKVNNTTIAINVEKD